MDEVFSVAIAARNAARATQRWPARPAIRARYDTAARAAGYSDLEGALADVTLTASQAGQLLGVSNQSVLIMRRQRGIALPRKRPEPVRREPTAAYTGNAAPVVLRHRVARALRELRADSGWTMTDAADTLGWSPSKLLRVEHGLVRLMSPTDLRALLDHYQVTDQQRRDELEAMAWASRSRSQHPYQDVLTRPHLDYVATEAAATWVVGYYPTVLPELLQTPEYARAAIPVFMPPGVGLDVDVDLLVEARLHHQRLLDRLDPPPPRMTFLVEEPVLLRGPAGDTTVLDRQLAHLAKLAGHPQIDLRVLQLRSGAHPLVEDYRGVVLVQLGQDDEPLLFCEQADYLGFSGWREQLDHFRWALGAVEFLATPVTGPADLAMILGERGGQDRFARSANATVSRANPSETEWIARPSRITVP